MSELEAQAFVWYLWCCPECGEVQECEPPDVEPAGEEVECRDCGAAVTVTGS